MPEEHAVIGKRLPRIDALEKITGSAKYLPDLKIPGMLYGKILRSPYAHARIGRVNTSAAEKIPGVRAVITGRDTLGMRLCIFPHLANKPPLAEDRVRFIGDEIAAVAADNENLAEEALESIEVEYEELPAVFDPQEALKPEAVRIHEQGNVAAHRSWSLGDPEKAFGGADHVFADRFETQAQLHCCLEPQGCIARLDPGGNLTFWVTTQWPHPYRMILADLLGLPHSRVRVIQVHMGGGFGGRSSMEPIDLISYFLAKKTKRPVRIINTHDEQFTSGRFRYPMIIDIRTAVKKDGTLLAREVKVLTDNGAYNNFGVAVTGGIGVKSTYLWGVPNVKFEADVVFTNKVYGSGFRGFGNPQITFAIESQMDRIAEELGLDMKGLCLRNVNREGQLTCMGHKITSCGLEECIEKATEAAGWAEKRRKKGNRGVGMASLMHTGGGVRNLYGACNLSDVFIKMNNDGTIDLSTGAAEIGQGSDTVLAQIAAEELGLRLEDVNLISGDTSTTPVCLGAWGSRETFIAGNATKIAAGQIKERLLEEAAKTIGVPAQELRARNRMIYRILNPEQAVPIAQIALNCYNSGNILAGRGIYDDPVNYPIDPRTGYGAVCTYAFGTHVAEVEVDRDTGLVKVLNYVAVHDLGKAINPMTAEGQIEGGVVQGLGYALSEKLVWEEGLVLNANFQDYRIFYIQDAPPIQSILVESNDPDGPFGAKGLAEPATVPTAAAVANAIYDAVGVRICSLPITPEKILQALKENRQDTR